MSAAAFFRSSISGDQVVPPFLLSGSRRQVFLITYYAILLTALAGMAYTFLFNPALGLAALTIGYVFDNVAFCLGHQMLHAAFIETPEPKMGTLEHHSFIHHYRNVRVFHETWLETRMSYFLDPRALLTLKKTFSALVGVFALVASSYLIHPALGAALYSGVVLPILLQSTIHEWYHCPPAHRKVFYSIPAYWLFTALEKIGLASTKGHTIHHRHGLTNLKESERWLDLYIPFAEAHSERLWLKTLSLHEPGMSRMYDFMRRGTPAYVRLALRLLTLLLIVAAYYWIVK